MFSTIVSAIKSRTAVAAVGATTTYIALNNMLRHEATAKDIYAKLLAEEAKVTELKAQLRGRDAALNAALDKLNAAEAEAAEAATEKEGLADLMIAAASIVGAAGLAALFNGRGCIGSCRELQ